MDLLKSSPKWIPQEKQSANEQEHASQKTNEESLSSPASPLPIYKTNGIDNVAFENN